MEPLLWPTEPLHKPPATEYGLVCLDHWPRLPAAVRIFVATTPPVERSHDGIRSRYEAVQAVIVGLDGLG